MHLRRRSKTRIFEGCATKLGGRDLCIGAHVKEEKGRQAGCPGKGSRGEITREEDGFAVEGVFDESHVADVRDGCETSCQLS